jgi:hypothetical protein
MYRPWSFGAAAHAPGKRQGSHKPRRPPEQHAYSGQHQRRCAIAQNIPCTLALNPIFRIDNLAIPAPQGNSHDFDAATLESEYFPPDENVADRRILID